MRVIYQLGEEEQAGTARGLDTAGLFVLGPAARGSLSLRLEAQGVELDLPGQVVDTTPEGFAFVFEALPLTTLERLAVLLRSGPQAVPPASPPEPAPGMAVQGEDWMPPVTEPTLHEWMPDKGPLQPARAEGEAHGLSDLPTLTASAEAPPAPAPAPAPQTQPQAQAPRPRTSLRLTPTTRGGPVEEIAAPAPATPARPAGAERRQQERHDQSIPVAFDNLTSLIKEFTHNISFGGMFVYTHAHLPKGTTTTVTLIHPVSGERLSLEARVAHSAQAPSPDPASGQPRYGLGLEFVLPPEELKPLLSAFISAHQRAEGEPPSSEIISAAREILARASGSAYHLLGLPEGAAPAQVRATYFALVDRFHPDRHYGKIAAAERQVLEELFRRLTKAYQELTA